MHIWSGWVVARCGVSPIQWLDRCSLWFCRSHRNLAQWALPAPHTYSTADWVRSHPSHVPTTPAELGKQNTNVAACPFVGGRAPNEQRRVCLLHYMGLLDPSWSALSGARPPSGCPRPDVSWHCHLCHVSLAKWRLRPRHHCRRCGRSVCGACSAAHADLEGWRGPQRVRMGKVQGAAPGASRMSMGRSPDGGYRGGKCHMSFGIKGVRRSTPYAGIVGASTIGVLVDVDLRC